MSGAEGRSPLGWLVTIVEGLTVVAVLATVVLLFANEPAAPPGAAPAVDGAPGAAGAGEVDGAAVYADECAVCHGSDGGGGVGPALAGGAVVAAFPEVADQVAIVTEGQGGMPSFGDRLSPDQIAAVVDYTRSL